MILDWLHNIIYWREIRDFTREADAMAANWEQIRIEMDRRIAEVFTPEELAETEARCERKLAEMGYGREQ
jgi:hypothetical protein